MSKRVIITGASSGIGKQTAERLSESGYSFLLLARREEMLKETADLCTENGAAQAEYLAIDFKKEREFGQVIKAVENLGEGEIVLVNNAGTSKFGPFHGMAFDEISEQIEVNLMATIALTHALLPTMLLSGSGQIINVLSIAVNHVFPGALGYSVSKAALAQFGKNLSMEYRKQGIRVTNIIPGAVATPLWIGDGGPPVDKMLSPQSVADTIMCIVESPPELVIDELVITPPDGIL